MAATNIVTIPSISQFASNITTTISCAIGNTYDALFLKFSEAADRARISNIQILINGKIIRTYKTTQDLLDENLYFTFNDVSGFLTINFDQKQLRNLNEVKSFGIGTDAGVQTLHVRFDCGADIEGTLKVWAQISAPKPLGLLLIRRNFSHNIVEGVNDISQFPRQGSLMAAFFKNSVAGNITNAQILRANQSIFDTPDDLNKRDLLHAIPRPRGAVANNYAIDHCLDGSLSGWIGLTRAEADDFRFRLIATAADAGMVMTLYTANTLANA